MLDEENIFNKIVQLFKNDTDFECIKNIIGPNENLLLFKYKGTEVNLGYDFDYGISDIRCDNYNCAIEIKNKINSIK